MLAAEDMLRRYGPEKTTVRDVARALGVTHAAIYRHFSSKDALREAVADRWLRTTSAPLQPIVADADAPALERLERWIRTMFESKRSRALAEPELFGTYTRTVVCSSDAIGDHHDRLQTQLRALLAQGVEDGSIRADDISQTAQAIWDATIRFRSPLFSDSWSAADVDQNLDGVIALIRTALAAR